MTRAELVERMSFGEYIGWIAHFQLVEFEHKQAQERAR